MESDPKNRSPQIIYVMGAGRSGSTILNIILGAHPEIEAIGEAKHWALYKGLPRDYITNSEDHVFWKNVLEEYSRLESGFPNFDEIERTRYAIESHSMFIRHLWCKTDPEKVKNYHKHISNLFLSVFKVSGKKFILDTSKNILRAHRLLKNPQFNVKVIHLIRDPRGIVWSFMKKDVEHKPKMPLKTLFDYVLLNLASAYIKYSSKNSVIKVKYENFINEPEKTLKQIFRFVGVEDGGVIEKIKAGTDFEVNHIIDGNRIRKNKAIRFIPDEEWKKKLPFRYKLSCMILAWPVYLL